MSINTLAHVFTPHGNIVYTANDFRQTVRISVAGTIALSISTFYNVQYGVFFVVYPLMLLSLVPVFNRHVARQFVFSAAVNCVEMVLIVGYLSQWPVIMTLVVFGLYVMRFRFMSKGPLFLLGSMGVVCQSTMLNFMSVARHINCDRLTRNFGSRKRSSFNCQFSCLLGMAVL